MRDVPKNPPVYKPSVKQTAAPPVYKPAQMQNLTMQLKPAASFRPEMRPAPPVYCPQMNGLSVGQSKLPAPAKTPPSVVSPTRQYELSSPVWIGNGRQQIRVTIKGAPAPIGSVDVHYNQPGKAYISDLTVTQAHRRHGVGTMLMKAALDAARRNGSIATELEARPGPGSISNQALLGMYSKLGFREKGISRRGNPIMGFGRASSLQVEQRVPVQRKAANSKPSRPVIARLGSSPVPVPLLNSATIQRMQTGAEVTSTNTFAFQDYQGGTVTSHHHQTMEQFVTTYRVAESGHTNWDTQKQFTGHRNRCAACIGVYAEDQAGQSHIFSRDVIYDGCANLYSSGDGRETKAQIRPEIREVSLSGGQSQLTTTRREFASPQLTQYQTNIGGYSVKLNVVDPLIVKANLLALNAWGMNKKRTGGGNVAYTAASHHHSEQVIVIALQGADTDIAQWLANLIQTNQGMAWYDYTILVHSEREMCANCAKAFNGYIEHPTNYPQVWALIKKHFTYLPTATFQVSSRVDFNQNRAPQATQQSQHGHQTFVTSPSHSLASNVNFPGQQQMDDIYS